MKALRSTHDASGTSHRMAAANSQSRRIKLIGLGSGGAAIVSGIDTASLQSVQIVNPQSGHALSELSDSEMIFLVACSGDDLALAPKVKPIASAANVMITGILVQSGAAQSELPVLRAASDMLIVVADANYVSEMLEQLGA